MYCPLMGQLFHGDVQDHNQKKRIGFQLCYLPEGSDASRSRKPADLTSLSN